MIGFRGDFYLDFTILFLLEFFSEYFHFNNHYFFLLGIFWNIKKFLIFKKNLYVLCCWSHSWNFVFIFFSGNLANNKLKISPSGKGFHLIRSLNPLLKKQQTHFYSNELFFSPSRIRARLSAQRNPKFLYHSTVRPLKNEKFNLK